MGTITNNSGLPIAIVNAIKNAEYDRGLSDITVTQLIAPPRKVALETQYKDEIEEDVADLIFALLGSAVHYILEKANLEGLVEERLYADVKGWKVGGQVDHLSKDGILTDYKVMSVWEAKHGLKDEKEQQLNLLAELARENGYAVNGLQIVSIYRDWSKSKARYGDHPKEQIEVHNITLWGEKQAKEFMNDRVSAHQKARMILPECSDSERWMDEPTFAVMKKTNKRALRLMPTLEEAQKWAADNKLGEVSLFDTGTEKVQIFDPIKGVYIERRENPPRRCLDYCAVSQWCEQWAEYKKKHNIKE